MRSDLDWSAAYEWVSATWHGLDLLVNNAGVGSGGALDEAPMSEWQRVVDINLLGVVRGCRTLTPMLRAQRSGHLVNIASAAGLVHPTQMATCSAVKAAVVALSEILSFELRPHGISTSVVCPTFFESEIAANMPASDALSRSRAQAMIDASPRTADQIAAKVLEAVDEDRYLILPDREVKVAYTTKWFARRFYDARMSRLAVSMLNRQQAEPRPRS